MKRKSRTERGCRRSGILQLRFCVKLFGYSLVLFCCLSILQRIKIAPFLTSNILDITADKKSQMPPQSMIQLRPLSQDENVVVVVGGGLAGLSASIEAAKNGAKVILLEKESKVGGNSAKATSGINAWGTSAQRDEGIDDNATLLAQDTRKSGNGGTADPNLVQVLSQKSKEAVEWLTSFGVPLTALSQLGGHCRKRTHRAADNPDGRPIPVGFVTISTLQKHITSTYPDRISVVTGATVQKLLYRDNDDSTRQIMGVQYIMSEKSYELSADAVILSTGGFSNDRTTRSLLQEHAPHLASFPTTNGHWATGDGVKMAKELGVELVDMDKVQLHPTGLIDPKDPSHRTKYLGPEALRGSGGILLNKRGERFINELDLRSVVSQAIIAQNDEYPNCGGSKFAHCVLNEEAVKLFGVNSLGFYWKRLGLFEKVEDTAALAKLIGCPEETVVKTLKQYEEISSGNRVCPLTGKAVFPCKLGPQGPFYVAFVTPSIHYTMGGCLISPSGEIQTCEHDSEGLGQRRPILGLFGAGEVTGGVHGKNRLGGNSLLECVVFGKIVGDRAASFETTGRSGLLNRAVVTVTEVNPLFSGAGVEVVLSFTSSTVTSGLGLFQKIRVEDEASVESVVLLPSSSPLESGVIRVYLADGEPRWLSQLESFTKVHVAVEEDFYWKMEDASPLEINMLVLSHSGVAAVMQLLRHAKNNPTMFSRLNLFLSFSIEKNMLTKLVLAILHTTECSVTLDSRFAKQESYPDFKVDTLKNFVSISRLGRDRLDRMSRYFFAAGFSISQETNEELLALKSMNNLIHF